MVTLDQAEVLWDYDAREDFFNAKTKGLFIHYLSMTGKAMGTAQYLCHPGRVWTKQQEREKNAAVCLHLSSDSSLNKSSYSSSSWGHKRRKRLFLNLLLKYNILRESVSLISV